ncbi:nicotinamidase [Rugosimonospora acidiphila]|uniref:Nicotinamidase n=2 Tax=Rugosimonospora acidiphila TaxID=556531 RepID=A0ABP9RNS2_9ACTN
MIDVQRDMLEPPLPVPSARQVGAAIRDVLDRARQAGAQVVHVRNNGGADDPDAPDSLGWELVHEVRDGEHLIDKSVPDSFDGTGLDKILPDGAPLILVGMQSDYCVRATALAALSRGHQVTLVRDAHATYDDEVPAAQASRRVEDELRAAGAMVIGSEDVRFD